MAESQRLDRVSPYQWSMDDSPWSSRRAAPGTRNWRGREDGPWGVGNRAPNRRYPGHGKRIIPESGWAAHRHGEWIVPAHRRVVGHRERIVPAHGWVVGHRRGIVPRRGWIAWPV